MLNHFYSALLVLLICLFFSLKASAELSANGLFDNQSGCFSTKDLTEEEQQRLDTYSVARVVDGDTLKLSNGQKIRLIGVNTPELGFGGKKSQPFARQAKNFVEDLLRISDHRKATATIKVLTGLDSEDKYGRLLGYVFNTEGISLDAKLLEKGLAYHVAVPPNLRWAKCLANIEQQAAFSAAGLWGQYKSDQQKKLNTGYQRIQGKVKSVTFGRAWWISFEDDREGARLNDFVAVLYPEAQQYITQSAVQNWIGRIITVEGWVYSAHYKGQPQRRLKLETPYAWTLH